MKVGGVYCVWEWVAKPTKKNPTQRWRLLRSAVAYDGYCEGVRTLYWTDSQMVDGDGETVGGRCITEWSMGDGVRLVTFDPPTVPEWVVKGGFRWLAQCDGWWAFIAGAYDLLNGTTAEAAKVLKEVLK